MEVVIYNPSQNGQEKNYALTVISKDKQSERKPFVEANTSPVNLLDLRQQHIIPTYKDASPLISHADFVDVTDEVVHQIFVPERINSPEIRVSHPVLGRIPEAKNKPASELQDWEQTIYYERMAFCIEVPSIHDRIGSETISLTIGGVRKYDNINLRNGSDQHFKVFAGFKVSVCCNLCVWSDGVLLDVRVKTIQQLKDTIYGLINEYDAIQQVKRMEEMLSYSLTEQQFAHLIGKARLYNYLPSDVTSIFPEFLFTDSQVSTVCKEYYTNENFGREFNGEISLWKFYNLLTAANKSSYIDSFISRSANASNFIQSLSNAIAKNNKNWFLP